MARTSIAISKVPFQKQLDPVSFTAADATNGMKYENDGRTVLLLKGDATTAVTVTVKSVADEAGRTGDLSIALAAGEQVLVGPLRKAWWNQSDGTVHVDFSAALGTVAALRLNF